MPERLADGTASSRTARATLMLRRMVLEGRFSPGEHIREVPLASELGLSRIPLRLALERLSHEGLLSPKDRRGFEVAHFSPADILDAIDLRGTLEGAAARQAAERLADPRDVDLLLDLSDQMFKLVRHAKMSQAALETYIDLNARFHAELVELAGSRILRRAVDHASSLPFASPSSFIQVQMRAPDTMESFLIATGQHKSIAEAILNREGLRAEMLAREHARVAGGHLKRVLEDRSLLRSMPGAKLIQM